MRVVAAAYARGRDGGNSGGGEFVRVGAKGGGGVASSFFVFSKLPLFLKFLFFYCSRFLLVYYSINLCIFRFFIFAVFFLIVFS